MMLMTAAVLSGPCLLVPLGRRLARSSEVAVRRPDGYWPRPQAEDLGSCRRTATRRPWSAGGAAAAVLAAALPTGPPAGVAATGWLAVTVSLWLGEVRRWWRRGRALPDLPLLVAWGWLPVAAGWFVASRSGVAPLGFGEPITLLTAAHFHVAGFGLSVLGIATARHLDPRRTSLLAWAAWVLVTAGPVGVAVGFAVDEPVLNMVGAFTVAVGVFALSPCLVFATRGASNLARWCGWVAAVVPLVPMVLAVAYSLGPVLGTPSPSIGLMVRAHGIVNALGFVGLGLLAFVLAEPRVPRSPEAVEEVAGAVAA